MNTENPGSAEGGGRLGSLVDRTLGLAIAAAAFVVYVATSTSTTPIGDAPRLIVQHLSLIPFATTSNPVWGLAARIIDHIPAGAISSKLSFFSALCGAAAVFLVFDLILNIVRHITRSDSDTEPFAVPSSRLCALAGSLFLVSAIPFWSASNRPSPDSFGILMLLITTRLFFEYVWSDSKPSVFACAFLLGLGVVEFPTFVLFVPVFGLAFLFLAWIRGELRAALLIQMVLLLTMGLSVYFLEAWRFYRSPSYEFAGLSSYLAVVARTLGHQLAVLKSGVLLQQWLVIHLLAVVPAVAAAFTARQALNAERQIGYYLLHSVFAATAIVLLLNPGFSPIDPATAIYSMVTPYVLASWVFAQTIGYSYLLIVTSAAHSESPLAKRVAKVAAISVPAVALLLASSALVLNWRHATARSSAYVGAHVDSILDSVGERSLLITDGILDSHILVRAHDARRTIRLVDKPRCGNALYMKYIASLFDSPRLKSMAQIGIMPLLHELSVSTPHLQQDLAVMGEPDLWAVMRMTAVPARTVFLGVRDVRSVDADQLFDEHVDFWSKTVPALKECSQGDGFAGRPAKHLLSRLSLVANNLGVFLQDVGKHELAFQAYCESLAMHPEGTNVSAVLNLANLVGDKQMHSLEGYGSAVRAFDMFEKGDKSQYLLRPLAKFYGYVWNPRPHLARNWTWVRSGSRQATIPILLDVIRRQNRDAAAARKSLAALYLVRNQSDKNEELFREILEDYPEDNRALLSLARILANRGDLQGAEDLLTRTRKAGVPDRAIALERAVYSLTSGKIDKAKDALTELVASHPDYTSAWAVLGDVLLAQHDHEPLDECVKQLEKEAGRHPQATATLARIAVSRGDLTKARWLYNAALRISDQPLHVLTALLDLDVRELRRNDARDHLGRILAIDRDHAVANYVLATLQIHSENYDLAEDSLRRSLRRRRSPEGLNSLAWTLYQRGKPEEALPYAVESLKLDDSSVHAWDTLGMIHLELGRLKEAREALEKSVFTLGGVRSDILMHLAQVYEKNDMPERSLEIVRACLSQERTLSRETARTLRDMRQRLLRNQEAK